MWKYDVKLSLKSSTSEGTRSGRFLTHTLTHARQEFTRTEILWTATCWFFPHSDTQPVGVGAPLRPFFFLSLSSTPGVNVSASVEWLQPEAQFCLWKRVHWPKSSGALRINSHMVHFIPEQQSALRGAEMKAGAVLLCVFFFIAHFKWLDTGLLLCFWSIVSTDSGVLGWTLATITRDLRSERQPKLQARLNRGTLESTAGTTPWPAACLPWSECGGALTTARTRRRGVTTHWRASARGSRASSTGGCGRTKRGRCRRKSCPSWDCRTDRGRICPTESTTPLRFSCWTCTKLYRVRRKAKWKARWRDTSPFRPPRAPLWQRIKKQPSWTTRIWWWASLT